MAIASVLKVGLVSVATVSPSNMPAACAIYFNFLNTLVVVDVDECALNIDHCHPLAQCNNLAGGYSCSDCPFGYTTGFAGDVQTCTGKMP